MTKKLVEINEDSRGAYNTNSQIKFKTSILGSGLCDYSILYILVSRTKTIIRAGDGDAARKFR